MKCYKHFEDHVRRNLPYLFKHFRFEVREGPKEGLNVMTEIKIETLNRRSLLSINDARSQADMTAAPDSCVGCLLASGLGV